MNKMGKVSIVFVVALSGSLYLDMNSYKSELHNKNNIINELKEELELSYSEMNNLHSIIVDNDRLLAESQFSSKTVYFENLKVYSSGNFKSYMDRSKITDTTSQAYKVSRTLELDANGMYHKDGFMAIALPSVYGKVGNRFRITLSSGQVFYAIMSDTKDINDLNENHEQKYDKSVIEFIVNVNMIDSRVKALGSFHEVFVGSISKIERLMEV